MSSFLVAIKNLSRHEGDTSDISVIIPDIIEMPGTSVKFEVKDFTGRTIIRKSTDDGTIQVIDQEIYVPLLSADTKGKPGKFQYEIELTTVTAIITVLTGNFTITKELIQ